MGKPSIFADFQNADPRGRVRLTCRVTLRDLARLRLTLREGMELTITDDGLEADAVVVWSIEESRWAAVIDWDRIRDVPLE